MAITLKHIFDKTMFFLKKESKFFTSSEVKNIIAIDSFRRIAEEIGYPKDNHIVVLTSGSWIVSTPIDFIKIDVNSEGTYYDGKNITKITPKEQTEIGREEILSATPGIPENFFLESESKIGVYPPSTSGQVIVPYVKHPTIMSSDTDTNQLTEKCYMAAVYWTVAECFMKDSDERYTIFKTHYENEVTRLKGQYNTLINSPKDIHPHEDYR